MEWYVIIPSEVTQRYIQHHIRNDWNYSQVVERFVLVRTDSASSKRVAGEARVQKYGSIKPLILKG